MVRLPRGREWLVGGAALGALVAAFVVVYVFARGGGDGPSAEQVTGDPTPGASGELTAAALPGEGWTSAGTELVSLFDSPDPVFAATPDLSECAPMQAFEGALFENESAFSDGESQLFERPLADGGTLRVTRLTVTFADPVAVEAILTAAREALGGPDFGRCMLAIAARDGIEATAAEGAALPVPPGGVSRVLRYTAAAAAGGGTVTQAVGWWGEGERLVALTISAAGEGPDDAELATIARAAGGAR